MRKVGTIVQVLLACVLLLYAVDWAVLHARATRGTAYQTVQVNEYLATPLKGNKAEFDYMERSRRRVPAASFPGRILSLLVATETYQSLATVKASHAGAGQPHANALA